MVFTGYIVLIIGAVTSLIGLVMFLNAAYRRSLWWMLACLLVPPVCLIFLVVDLKAASTPFGIALAGILLECVGGTMAGIDL